MLSAEEKQEMIEDAKDVNRGKVFLAARKRTQEGGIDEYVDFLSQNIGFIELVPSKRIATNFKL